jgi:hypothetical protein
MCNEVHERAVWSLHGNVAELSCGKLSGRVDATRPNAGLHNVTMDRALQATELIRIYRSDVADTMSWCLPLAESYIRGDDFIASYEATEDWPFSPQLYWRANSLSAVDGVLASASLLVSVQTHLLDTMPQMAVTSLVPSDEALLVSVSNAAPPRAVQVNSSEVIPSMEEDCCIVQRFQDLPLSYVEIMPAGDFHATRRLSYGKSAAFEWRLFSEFLEKGVIRRARVHSAILPRENDIEIALVCCKAIDALELPLTT